jgi:hypothetical protein
MIAMTAMTGLGDGGWSVSYDEQEANRGAVLLSFSFDLPNRETVLLSTVQLHVCWR